MTGEKVDPSKADPSNAINVTYEELPEERCQEFEAKLKLLSCYGKTRQGVVEKEKFVMPSILSTNSPTSPVM